MQVAVPDEPAKVKPRGFATMSREKRRDIASMGGRASHAKGTGHQFTPEEARAASKKRDELRKARKAPKST